MSYYGLFGCLMLTNCPILKSGLISLEAANNMIPIRELHCKDNKKHIEYVIYKIMCKKFILSSFYYI